MGSIMSEENKSAPKILIAGAPASGKGTQCELIKEKYGVVHISTGDMLRDHVKRGTDLGTMAKKFMDNGELVPDDVIIGMVKEQLATEQCQNNGWLLDGFPRTRAQADALIEAGINAEHFILLDVPDDILVERVTGRRTDPVTGKIYHLTFNPPPDDEEVKSRLVHRSDDTAEKIKTRVKAFHDNVDSIMECYTKVLCKIDGNQNKNDVFAKICDRLG